MNPFVHQLGSPGNRRSVSGAPCTVPCWGELGAVAHTPCRSFPKNVASPWRPMKAQLEHASWNQNYNFNPSRQSQGQREGKAIPSEFLITGYWWGVRDSGTVWKRKTKHLLSMTRKSQTEGNKFTFLLQLHTHTRTQTHTETNLLLPHCGVKHIHTHYGENRLHL